MLVVNSHNFKNRAYAFGAATHRARTFNACGEEGELPPSPQHTLCRPAAYENLLEFIDKVNSDRVMLTIYAHIKWHNMRME